MRRVGEKKIQETLRFTFLCKIVLSCEVVSVGSVFEENSQQETTPTH